MSEYTVSGRGGSSGWADGSSASDDAGNDEGMMAKRRRVKERNVPAEESIGHRILRTCLTDMWNEPLHAVSRTQDRIGHIDFAMVVPPIRAFVYYMICPYLAYPVALLSLYGFYRCLRTVVLPKSYRRDQYEKHVFYGVQKRVYDPRQKRLLESVVDDVGEIKYALSVTDGTRNQFVDDPKKKGTAYFVVEQRVMKTEAVFTGENWAWAWVSDSCRYGAPIALAYLFRSSCSRLTVDLRLWFQGRLYWFQVRHPITNFFRSYAEYNRAMQRVNVVKPAAKGAQPWSRNL